MKYLIWAYDYSHASAGPKTLHRLCHELNEAGERAFIALPSLSLDRRVNPEWNTPIYGGPIDDDWIAVYPEIIRGNPLGASRVVRYVLNTPGKLGGDPSYDPSEIVYVFHEQFNSIGVPPERIMMLPTIELDIYRDYHLPREGELVYVGKGHVTRDIPAPHITLEMRGDRKALADALNRAAILYSFDDVSGMIDIARLCGCPVVVVPTGQVFPPDSEAARSEQLALRAAFRERLPEFIRVTQEALVPA